MIALLNVNNRCGGRCLSTPVRPSLCDLDRQVLSRNYKSGDVARPSLSGMFVCVTLPMF